MQRSVTLTAALVQSALTLLQEPNVYCCSSSKFLGCGAGARRNSHKPNEVVELQQFKGSIMAGLTSGPNTLASKCVGGAFSAALDGGGATPRNTAASDTQDRYFMPLHTSSSACHCRS